MRIGIMTGSGFDPDQSFNGFINGAKYIESLGFSTLWMSTIYHYDSLTALAAIGRETSTIELGTAVVASFPRHPMAMAQQALTAADASNGRFTLGLGLSHKYVIEEQMGLSYEKPAQHMQEYLTVMMDLMTGKAVNFKGQRYKVNVEFIFDEPPKVPVIIAALGPKMLEIAGTMTDGTNLWLVGPKTLQSHVVPVINDAAKKAGKDKPRIVSASPIVLTKNIDQAKAYIGAGLEMYRTIPSYRRMMDHEGVAGPEDLAMLGDKYALRDHLQQQREIGVTDFNALVMETEEGAYNRTLEFLASEQ